MSHFTGSLKVLILEADGLEATVCAYQHLSVLSADVHNKLCPFVAVYVDSEEVGRTSVQQSTATPNWCKKPVVATKKTKETKKDTPEKKSEEKDEKTEESKEEVPAVDTPAVEEAAAKTEEQTETVCEGYLVCVEKLVKREMLTFTVFDKHLLSNQYIADKYLKLKDIESGKECTLDLEPCGHLKVKIEVTGDFSDLPVEKEKKETPEEKKEGEPTEGEVADDKTDADKENKKEEKKVKAEELKPRKTALRPALTYYGHKLLTTMFAQPVFCAICDGLVIGPGATHNAGRQCQLCALVVHKRCQVNLVASCTLSRVTSAVGALLSGDGAAEGAASSAADKSHKLVPQNCIVPVHCQHCGLLMAGLASDCLRCEDCRRNFHKRCEGRLGHDCRPVPPPAEKKEKPKKKPDDDKTKKDNEEKKADAAPEVAPAAEKTPAAEEPILADSKCEEPMAD